MSIPGSVAVGPRLLGVALRHGLVVLLALLAVLASTSPVVAASAAMAVPPGGSGAPAPTELRVDRAGEVAFLQVLVLRVEVSGPPDRPVALQRHRDGRWRTEMRARTGGNGAVLLRSRLPAGSSRWRVVAPRVPGHAAATTTLRLPRPARSMVFGVNVWRADEVPGITQALGLGPRVVGLFRDWVNDGDLPVEELAAIRAGGALPMIAWEPWDSHSPSTSQPAFRCAEIAAGRHDALLERWADQARGYAHPILIRMAPEQNGDWRPWSIGVQGNRGRDYVAAWRHVVRLFRARGAHNVVWIWNPFVLPGAATSLSAGYPGPRYVDAVGLDGHNWGATRPWGWQGYRTIFGSTVRRVQRLAPGKPWLIAETASAPGPRRPEWVADAVASARRDGAVAFVWFEFDKEADWRLARDPAAAQALRRAMLGGRP